jgi:hypothetical protein
MLVLVLLVLVLLLVLVGFLVVEEEGDGDGDVPDLSRCTAEGSCREPLRRKVRGVPPAAAAGVTWPLLPVLGLAW